MASLKKRYAPGNGNDADLSRTWANDIEPRLRTLFSVCTSASPSAPTSVNGTNSANGGGLGLQTYGDFMALHSAVYAAIGSAQMAHHRVLYAKLDEFLGGVARGVARALSPPPSPSNSNSTTSPSTRQSTSNPGADSDDGETDNDNGGADDDELMRLYLDKWKQYNAALKKVKSTFANFERGWVSREVQEGRGWLRFTPGPELTYGMDAWVGMEREALVRWYPTQGDEGLGGGGEGGGQEVKARARARAEAASGEECIVPPYTLGLRRWRMEVVLPFIRVATSPPSADGRGAGNDQVRLSGLLGRAVRRWTSPDSSSDSSKSNTPIAVTAARERSRREMLVELDATLHEVGVHEEDAIRAPLVRYLQTFASSGIEDSPWLVVDGELEGEEDYDTVDERRENENPE